MKRNTLTSLQSHRIRAVSVGYQLGGSDCEAREGGEVEGGRRMMAAVLEEWVLAGQADVR